MIVRLHGRGEALTADHHDFPTLSARFPAHPGMRAIIRVRLTRISDSCGYGVPRFAYEGERDTLDRWVESKGTEGLAAYRREKNARSIDGLAGLDER